MSRRARTSAKVTCVVVLSTDTGGEIDRAVVRLSKKALGDDPDEAVNLAIHDAIDNWALKPGDAIEVQGAT